MGTGVKKEEWELQRRFCTLSKAAHSGPSACVSEREPPACSHIFSRCGRCDVQQQLLVAVTVQHAFCRTSPEGAGSWQQEFDKGETLIENSAVSMNWLHLCHTSWVRNTSDSRGSVTRKSSG